MRKRNNPAQKIMLLTIGVLSIVLMAVLIWKVHQFHQEKLQRQEWQVRRDEVQAELEDVTMKIEELSEDSTALQIFLQEELNVGESVAAPSQDWEDMPQSGDAILVDAPPPVQPQPPEEENNSISDNSAEVMAIVETVSNNRSIPVEEEEETVSENGRKPEPEEETISGNSSSQSREETVSGNGGNQAQAEETVSGNGNIPELPEETVSGNRTAEEPQSTISGNAIVNGQVIPFQYKEADLTLEARRNIRSSYVETEQTNGRDKYVISNSSYNFSDLTIACLGDSITAGSNMNNLDNYEQYSYPSVLKNILRAKEVYNLGIGGSSYGRYWDQAFVDRYREIPQDTDIILVMGGTNDGFAASQKELGSLAEKKPKTYYGDVDELMRGLKKDYPEAKIIFATPLPNVLHDYLRNQRDYLLPQSAFAQAVKELAAQHGIDVIDLYNSNLLDTHDAQIISSYMPDGVHGNPAGYQVLAEHMASQIIQIMEKDRTAAATVSGNAVAEGEGEGSVSGNGMQAAPEAVSGNASGVGNGSRIQDGKWIEDGAMSPEERAKEAQKAAEANQKVAQDAMLVDPAEPGQGAGGEASEPVQEQAAEEEPEEIENNYEYGGEAIIIQ